MPIASLQPSGVGPIDIAWGGLCRPGAYLLVGSASQGRLDLSTRIVGSAESGLPTLLFSAREPAAILSLGRQAGVDLSGAGDRIHLKGVPLGAQLASLGEAGLAKMLEGLAESARGTDRVVVEDFTPFVRFRSFDTFGEAFRRLVDTICGHGATLVLGLGEPANDGSRRLLAFVEGVVTGTVRVADGGRSLQLIPGVGHAGDQHELAWSRTDAPPPRRPAPAVPEPDEFMDHDSDGYGGSEPAAFSSGALVVSTIPSEPFGYPGAAPAPLPAPFGPDSLPFEPELLPAGSAPATPGVDGDGHVWATIQPVSAEDSEPAGTYPFDAQSSGFLIDSDQPGMAVAPTLAPAGAVPDVPAPIPPAPAVASSPADLVAEADFGHADPEAGFTDDLEEAFAASSPFLVMALRIAADSPHFDAFPTIADGLLGALSGRDRALVRDDEAKMVVLLPQSSTDMPQRLIAAVRTHLEGVLPDRAEAALRAVAVLVLPDGKPFTDAKGVLGYVLG